MSRANRAKRRFRGHVGAPAGANRAKRRFRGHVGNPAGANRVERRFRAHVGDPAGANRVERRFRGTSVTLWAVCISVLGGRKQKSPHRCGLFSVS